jgi:hypothetical protein
MAAIYANSYVTVAATEGSGGEFGLPGLFAGLSRQQPFARFDFGFGCILSNPRPDKHHNNMDHRYHSRDWTFQEWGLSHRKLVFHNQTVSWLCHARREQENGYAHSLQDKVGVTLNPTQLWPRWPDICHYLEMVMIYTMRDLSDSEDISAAFSAIITVMGRAMLGGVFHGLPELFFGSMLLWEPEKAYTQRRTDLNGAISEKFPSWSWTGWAGPISMSVPLLMFRPKSEEDYEWTFTHVVEYGERTIMQDTLGSVVGTLHKVNSPGETPKKSIKLMRISAMDIRPQGAAEPAYQKLWSLLHRGCPDNCHRDISICALKYHWNLELYNVLWIEWEDGVAYRKAVGTILRDAWDAAETEEVDICLG